MSKFTTQEVDALQKGGNQRAREQFLREWDVQQMRLPNNSNPDKIREFIKNVYVDKKYCGSRTSDKPPRDTQNIKGGEDYKRASSYHSFSQSPPYDHQYEERKYGKQVGMLTRKPGSDRGIEGKLSSFLYSPDRQGEPKYENKFTNDNTGSRKSDYSASSDPSTYNYESPNFQAYGHASPPPLAGVATLPSQFRVASPPSQFGIASPHSQVGVASPHSQVAMEGSNKCSHAHRSASSGSIGSFDSNSYSSNSTNSGSLIDSVLEAGPTYAADATKIDLFNQASVPTHNTNFAPSIDLFADFNHLPLTSPSIEQNPVPAVDTGGWANFGLSYQIEPASQAVNLPHIATTDVPEKTIDLFASMHNNVDWSLMQSSNNHVQPSLTRDQWSTGLNEASNSSNTSNTQAWSAFSDPIGSTTQPLPAIVPQNSDSQDKLHELPAYVDLGFKPSEVTFNDGFLIPSVDEKVPAAAVGMTNSSFFPPSKHQTGGVSLERKVSLNPFDFSFDLEPEANNVFLDMSALQVTLPDQPLPSFPDSSPDLWFQQNSLASFIPPASQDGLTHNGGQAHNEVPTQQLQNIPSHGPIAPFGGNPFA